MLFRFFILLICTLFLDAAELYVSSVEAGSVYGTRDRSSYTLHEALRRAQSGDTILLRKGIYALPVYVNRSGKPGKPITIRAYPGEKVVFQGNGTCKENDFRIRGNWIVCRDFEIRRSCNGLMLEKGASHNLIENIRSHENHFSGFIITRKAAYNILKNCDAWDNFDHGGSMGEGGNADGFAIGSRIGDDQYVGSGNKLLYCRAWHNSDDGFDFWKSGNAVYVEGCLAYDNGLANGDGNGFKLGRGNPHLHKDRHILVNCKAWNNRQNGFDYNDIEVAQILKGNIAWHNLVNYKFMGSVAHFLQNNISLFPLKGDLLSAYIIALGNSWQKISPDDPRLKKMFVSFDDRVIRGARDASGNLPQSDFLKPNSIYQALWNPKPTVYIIGDSTVESYPENAKKGGWGEFVGSFFPNVRFVNFAKSGKSSKTFREDGLWQKVLSRLKKGDYLLIQFGHNDSHAGKREGTTLTAYRRNIIRFIHEAKAKGAVPILVSPMHRRIFNADGTLKQWLGKYARVLSQVAAREHVRYIDLYHMSEKWMMRLGEKGSAYISCCPQDRTHFSKTGAMELAAMVASALRKTGVNVFK